MGWIVIVDTTDVWTQPLTAKDVTEITWASQGCELRECAPSNTCASVNDYVNLAERAKNVG